MKKKWAALSIFAILAVCLTVLPTIALAKELNELHRVCEHKNQSGQLSDNASHQQENQNK